MNNGLVQKLFIFLFFLLFSCASLSLAETPPAPLTFLQFSEKVVAYYPKLKAAHSDVQAALARQMQAGAGFWPSVNLSAGYRQSDDPVDVFGMLLRQERFAASDLQLDRLNTPRPHRDISAGVHAEVPLFDAMQTIYRTQAARQSVKAADADKVFTRMEALLVAQDAYGNAQVLEHMCQLADKVYQEADEDLKKAADLKEKGMILGADYFAARVMFGDIARLKNDLFRQKKAMQVLLNVLMGEPVSTGWDLVDVVPVQDGAVYELESLVKEAFVKRSDLGALELRYHTAALELSGKKAGALPAVYAFADGTNDRREIRDVGGYNLSVGVRADMPLFDPARSGRVREAKAKEERLGHDIRLLKDQITRDIAEALARHEALRDNLPVLEGMSEDSKEAVALIAPLYSEGRKSVADLMEARRSYLHTAGAYEKAAVDRWLSEGRIHFLTGGL